MEAPGQGTLGLGTQPADGRAAVVIIHAEQSFMQMVETLLAIETGAHVRLPGVDVVTATEVHIDPSPQFQSDEVFALDGELVPLGPLSLRVLPSALTVAVGAAAAPGVPPPARNA